MAVSAEFGDDVVGGEFEDIRFEPGCDACEVGQVATYAPADVEEEVFSGGGVAGGDG